MKQTNTKTIIKGILVAGLFSLLGGCIGKSNANAKDAIKTADIYSQMREQVLKITPDQLGIKLTDSKTLLAVLTETGYDRAVATLVTVADGTVSLYFSNGGGFIGAGQYDRPQKACESFIAFAKAYIGKAAFVKEYPLPSEGAVRFYFITSGGIFVLEEKENTLGNNQSPLSPLYFKAQEVITEARIADEKLRELKSAPSN